VLLFQDSATERCDEAVGEPVFRPEQRDEFGDRLSKIPVPIAGLPVAIPPVRDMSRFRHIPTILQDLDRFRMCCHDETLARFATGGNGSFAKA
jgi:hypothetical protein